MRLPVFDLLLLHKMTTAKAVVEKCVLQVEAVEAVGAISQPSHCLLEFVNSLLAI